MRFGAIILLAALSTGCTVKPDTNEELAGSQWQFVAIDDRAPVSENGSMQFEDGRLDASIGCNRVGGEWRIANGRLIAGPLAMTEMGCIDPATFEQERALAALLVAAPQLELGNGRLVLRSSGHSAELTRLSPPRPGE